MSEWEYRQVLVKAPDYARDKGIWDSDYYIMPSQELSAMGLEGWDLVTAFPLVLDGTVDVTVYVFKRPMSA